ncbi:MAG: hypothetical protein HC925_09355 [Coleofasciculaceae cyanobacterium SM2_3_26]|nr:hypothetical protein [Coleofasciculaceae cyanobacterium SM2_3_26]
MPAPNSVRASDRAIPPMQTAVACSRPFLAIGCLQATADPPQGREPGRGNPLATTA